MATPQPLTQQDKDRIMKKINLYMKFSSYLYPISLGQSRYATRETNRRRQAKVDALINQKPTHYINKTPVYYTEERLDEQLAEMAPKYAESTAADAKAARELFKGFGLL